MCSSDLTLPLPAENNPRVLFERMFGATDRTDAKTRAARLEEDRSLLDSVNDRVKQLQRKLSPSDNRKVNDYLTALRDVERRIQKAEEQRDKEMPDVVKPAGIPDGFEAHVRLLYDLQLLAFQADLTRVFTFVQVRESSVRSYPEIGVPDSHHPLSHHQNNAEKLAKIAKLNSFHIKQAAYLLDKMAKTKDGDGTMFDNMLLLYGSGMSDGNLHIPTNVPVFMTAGKGFGIKGGRVLHAAERTPLANLQLSILERFGMPMEQFGDSNGELKMVTGV